MLIEPPLPLILNNNNAFKNLRHPAQARMACFLYLGQIVSGFREPELHPAFLPGFDSKNDMNEEYALPRDSQRPVQPFVSMGDIPWT